ncbi:MAG TPA: hypothetical protein VMI35_02280 [Puia sp.]|nr:hypothetical protein [Puia sp.]
MKQVNHELRGAACCRTLLLFFVLCMPVLAGCQVGQERVRGWSSDIDTLLYIMKTQHYVYRNQPLPPKLLNAASELKARVAAYSDERMLTELERLAFYMHDGHSYILPVSRKIQSFYLPLQFYLFSDGVYIIDADESYKSLIGARVVQIHGVDVTKLVSDMNSFVHHDNLYTIKWFAPSVLRFRSLYECYGLAAGSSTVDLKVIDRQHQTRLQEVNFIPASDFHGIPKLFPSRLADNAPPLYLANVQDNFWFTWIRGRQILYFQFNQVEDKTNETLDAFGKRFADTLRSSAPRLLVVDVRHNNGGNLTLLTSLMNGIIRFEKENPTARIVIITGRNTFSAAQVFISLMNKNTHALFAGEPSSSSPNFVGEGNYIMLPYSGAMGSISNKYHESIPGDTRQWIEPDIPVQLSSKEYFANEDPVMKEVLRKMDAKW